jgi:cytochrome b involved in lipid metabolism
MSKKIIIIAVVLLVGFGLIQGYKSMNSANSNIVGPGTENIENNPVVPAEPATPSVQDEVVAPGATNETATPKPAVIDNSNKDTTTGTSPVSFTFKEVAKHNSSASCYTVVNDNVYDVTSFITKHPGGSSKILRICGKDGTASFTDQHGGQRKPEQELAGLQIGVLIK